MTYIAKEDTIIGKVYIKEGDIIDYSDNRILIINEQELYNRDRLNTELDKRLNNNMGNDEFELTKIQDGPLFIKLDDLELHIERPSKKNYKIGYSVFNWNNIRIRYTELYRLSQLGNNKYINSPLLDIRQYSLNYSKLSFNELIFFDVNLDHIHCLAVKKNMGRRFAEDFSRQFRLPVILIKFKMTFYDWMRTFPEKLKTLVDDDVYSSFEEYLDSQVQSIHRIFS